MFLLNNIFHVYQFIYLFLVFVYTVVNSKNLGALYSREKAKTGKMYPKNDP